MGEFPVVWMRRERKRETGQEKWSCVTIPASLSFCAACVWPAILPSVRLHYHFMLADFLSVGYTLSLFMLLEHIPRCGHAT